MENIGCGCIGTMILIFLVVCGIAYLFGWLFTLLLPIIIIIGCIVIAWWIFEWIIKELKGK